MNTLTRADKPFSVSMTKASFLEQTEPLEKGFFVKDKSGRGYTANLKGFDLFEDWQDEEDDLGNLLFDYVEQSEIGDCWITRTVEITRTS